MSVGFVATGGSALALLERASPPPAGARQPRGRMHVRNKDVVTALSHEHRHTSSGRRAARKAQARAGVGRGRDRGVFVNGLEPGDTSFLAGRLLRFEAARLNVVEGW